MSYDKIIKGLTNRAEGSWKELDQTLANLDPTNADDMEQYYQLVKAFKTEHIAEDQGVKMAHGMIKNAIQEIK